jgi:hypothetical protein
VLQLLNSKETNRNGRWQTDNREMTSAVKFLDSAGTLAASRLQPDEVAKALELTEPSAVAPGQLTQRA